MTNLFANPLAFEVFRKLSSYLEKHPELAKGDPNRDAMMIVGNICNDDDKLFELAQVIKDD